MLPILQLTIDLNSGTINTASGTELSIVIAIILPVVIILAILGMIFIPKFLKHRKHRKFGAGQDLVVLRVRLPRFVSSKEEESHENRQVQEDIAVAETVFAAIGALKAQKGFKNWRNGRTDHLSFEIVANEGIIYFYIVLPREFKEFMVQQVHAQFPDAELEEDEDYNIFTPTGVIIGSNITLERENLFPIKTYKTMDGDPISAIVNTLAKVPKDQGAAIQYTIRSAKKKWRTKGKKFVELMYQGATIEAALKGKKKKSGGATDLINLATGKDSTSPQNQEPQRRLSQKEEEMVKSIEEKQSRGGMDVNIRVISSAQNLGAAEATLNNILKGFSQYNIYQYGNSFKLKTPKNVDKFISDFIFRNFVEKDSIVLNTEELASLWHPPLSGMETTNIDWLGARKGGAPAGIPKKGLKLGENFFRGVKTEIFMETPDRQRHMYLIGKSGSGKSTMIENMARQDILNGSGVCVVDPHGDLVERLLGIIPKERVNDVIIFSPYDKDMPMGLNMLESPGPEFNDLVVQDMISIFYKLYPPEMIGPMFEHVMRNVMLTLMSDPENPGTIAEIPRMITDEDYQKQWVAKVKDPVVRAYWEKEVANTADFHKSEMFGYLTSKVGRFVEDAMMRNIIGQTKSGFNLREIMDEEKILFVDLAKGKTGEVNMQLLGLVIVSKLQMAAMARADIPEDQRNDFYLYIDEFQNFVTPSIATILSEARKYKLDLIMAHQYMIQVVEKGDTQIRDAILGNVGSMFVSRIGPEDTETFVKIFEPTFNANDLINSDKHTWYVKMIVKNDSVAPFTMIGTRPIEPDPVLAAKIRQLSRVTYARKRVIVEAEVNKRGGYNEPAKPKPPEPPAMPGM